VPSSGCVSVDCAELKPININLCWFLRAADHCVMTCAYTAASKHCKTCSRVPHMHDQVAVGTVHVISQHVPSN